MLRSKYPTDVAFFEVFNPDMQTRAGEAPEQAFFSPHVPTLNMLNAAYGISTASTFFLAQLKELSEFCGARGKLEGRSLEQTARLLATEYYYLKVSEVLLFFYRFKAGRYGKFYGAIDPLVITNALRDFLAERKLALQQRAREEQARRQEEEGVQAVTYEQYLVLKAEALRAHANGEPLSPEQARIIKALRGGATLPT